MNAEQAQALRHLLRTQEIAALGTLHAGEPFVSMVPFALPPDGGGFIIHVSGLAAHTKDMLANPAVSLLIVAPAQPDVPAQARARVTIQGTARQLLDSESHYADARRAYLGRFPHAADLFSFADFSLFAIEPRIGRFVGGFAQATSIGAETLAHIVRID
jgi:putative heme iron utilization protein